jgi:hypothetical protein
MSMNTILLKNALVVVLKLKELVSVSSIVEVAKKCIIGTCLVVRTWLQSE